MTATAAIFAGLLMLALPDEQDVIRTGNTVKPLYHRSDYESACGSAVFRVRFRNGPEEDGHVDHLLVHGRPVRNGAETLQIRAARRYIDRIEIMNCGMNPRRPIFRGAMKLSEAASQVASLRNTLFFRLSQEGDKGWRLSID